jgi:hypothetical protein
MDLREKKQQTSKQRQKQTKNTKAELTLWSFGTSSFSIFSVSSPASLVWIVIGFPSLTAFRS